MRVAGSASARLAAALAALVGVAAAAAACKSGPERPVAAVAPQAPSADDERTDRLRAFEKKEHEELDYARAPSSETALGADPWALAALPPSAGGGYVGVLRGRSQVVLLDASLAEHARAAAPRAPTGLAVSPSGEVYVAAGVGHTIARYTVKGGALSPSGVIDLGADVSGLRELAWAGGKLWALDDRGGRLFSYTPGAWTAPEARPVCVGAIGVKITERHVVVDCLFEHALVATPLGAAAAEAPVRIAHDGPIWGFDARETDNGLLIAAGGVEDHALDRTEGSFGFIDSFLFLYRGGRRVAEVNLSAHGVVTPKAVDIARAAGSETVVDVAGYGADAVARVELADGAPEKVSITKAVPGLRALVATPGGGYVAADPLLDAWVALGPGGATVVPAKDDAARERSTLSRVGEALIFTTLMAPWNKSDGRLSRFTCETCHFEGFGDGRVHWTGREDPAGHRILASTKPLFGLAANRPHFSRALDPDLATVAMNEFRVANAKNDHDPWFALARGDFPWLEHLGVPASEATLPPDELRRAFMAFLIDFTHRPNPYAAPRAGGQLTPEEQHGAEAFRDRCASCHAPRLAADDASSAVAFERWSSLVLSDAGPVVWGENEYKKTGVEPYVNERGARVPSLRRLYAKRPYFTNGSAKDLDAVLAAARWDAQGAFFHAGAPATATTALDEPTRHALRAFLDLL